MKEQKTNGWKIAAIILIVVVALETLLMGYFIVLGTSAIENENDCISECFDYGAESYLYNEYDEMCYCYDGAGDTSKIINMGG